MENVIAGHCISLVILAVLGRSNVCKRLVVDSNNGKIPSLATKEMNSRVHSSIHFFASSEIFAFAGNALFMTCVTRVEHEISASKQD